VWNHPPLCELLELPQSLSATPHQVATPLVKVNGVTFGAAALQEDKNLPALRLTSHRADGNLPVQTIFG
jgi:hypothetical protein